MTDYNMEDKSKNSFWGNLGMALSQGAMAMGQGMTGQPFLTNFQMMQMKQAEMAFNKWKEEQQAPETQAKARYYNSMADLYGNPSQLASVISGANNPTNLETTYSPEDYQIVEETRNIRGVPTVQKIRKLKPAISEKHGDVLSANSDYLSQLQVISDYIDQGAKTGITAKLPFMDTLRKQFGSDADIGVAQVMKQMQSKYITSQTGAQRGFQEMQWYEPSMPTMDMPPEKIKPMLQNSARLQELNIRNMLITAKKRNERLGEYRDLYNQLIEKYPTDIIPYGITQNKVMPYVKNIDKIKQALAEGHKMEDIKKYLNK